MNFSYKIEHHNKDTSQVLVCFTPDDFPTQPKFKWVNIDPTWTQEQIAQGIADQFPAYLWEVQINPNVDALLGTSSQATYVAPVIQEYVQTLEDKAEQIRSRRKGLLFDCDWTQLADAPLSAEEKAAWEVYRQALRDITNQAEFPTNVVWPVKE
jgi:hypothetical protein